MNGLGHTAMRQAIWEKQFWKGADEERDQKLDFDDVEKMCRRLNINPSKDDLLRRFKVRVPEHYMLCSWKSFFLYSKQTFRAVVGLTLTISETLSRLSKCAQNLTGFSKSCV